MWKDLATLEKICKGNVYDVIQNDTCDWWEIDHTTHSYAISYFLKPKNFEIICKIYIKFFIKNIAYIFTI